MEATVAAAAKPRARKAISTKLLADTLAQQHQLTKKQGQQMLADLAGLITKHLKKGERVRISGLGILQVRKRAARGSGGKVRAHPRHCGQQGGPARGTVDVPAPLH